MNAEERHERERDRVAEYALEAFLDGASDEEIDRYLRMQRADHPVV